MKIAIAQIDPVVGAFEGNVRKIELAYRKAVAAGARILVTPELSICGYPPHDLAERSEMFERNERAIVDLARLTQGQGCALLVGHIAANPEPRGRAAQNVVSVLENGKVTFRQAKTLLPTYDVFDEARYFEPASEIKLWNCDGKRVALAICEDLWGNDSTWSRPIYGRDPTDCYAEEKAELLISLSASPFEMNKRDRRESLHGSLAKRLGVPLIYVNQVGATDEVLFDGGSFLARPTGEIAGRLPLFRDSFGVIDTESLAFLDPDPRDREDKAPEEMEILTRALVSGIKEYFIRSGFKRAVLGLSGGIDSALVATLAVRALGAKNVLGVAMPSQYSSSHSLEDAEHLARNLGITLEVRPIKFLFATANRELAERRGTLASQAQENLQSRLRGMILMTLSNHDGALVLTTGNKSEIATGYCTLYGDMAGALAPIGDLYKTQVYELARFLNQSGSPIPERSITKAPSAELKPNQTDQDTLPPYEVLDPMLYDYIEKGLPAAELEKKHGKASGVKDSGWVRETLRKLELNEFKRRQAAPVLKVSAKAFGIGRRIPVSKVWDQ